MSVYCVSQAPQMITGDSFTSVTKDEVIPTLGQVSVLQSISH